MHTPNARNFNLHDWDCFAGAEPFQDGSPLIVDDIPVTIIADANGIEISSETFVYQVNKVTHPQALEPFWNQEIAKLILVNLAKTWSRMTEEEIRIYCEDHGFVKAL